VGLLLLAVTSAFGDMVKTRNGQTHEGRISLLAGDKLAISSTNGGAPITIELTNLLGATFAGSAPVASSTFTNPPGFQWQ